MTGSLATDPSFVNIDTTGLRYLTDMVRPAQTARSERTRDAMRQAALVRFLGQGVEETSAEQIAADAGVSLRTFYRHFTSKHDLLFADYDAGVEWFRAALADQSGDESLVDAVHAAVMSAPYDVEAVSKIAELRARNSNAGASCATSARWKQNSPRRWRTDPGRPAAGRYRRAAAHHRDGPLHRRGGVRRHGGVDARPRSLTARTRPAVSHGAGLGGQGAGDSTDTKVSSLLTKLCRRASLS